MRAAQTHTSAHAQAVHTRKIYLAAFTVNPQQRISVTVLERLDRYHTLLSCYFSIIVLCSMSLPLCVHLFSLSVSVTCKQEFVDAVFYMAPFPVLFGHSVLLTHYLGQGSKGQCVCLCVRAYVCMCVCVCVKWGDMGAGIQIKGG